MCGIAGEINVKEELRVEPYHMEMLGTLKRRGPDDDGVYWDKSAVLLHARLAVIDIENGRQPMRVKCGDGEAVIVYNGELYNTEDIRAELLAEGEQFFGHSDTEVLLKAYLHWGEDCLSKLNGIFAFAIWDSIQKRLFIARDRMGVKPFFYAVRGDRFIFGSELKALLCHPEVKPIIDREGIGELLFIAPGRTPGCGVFKDVFELKPGQSAVLLDGRLTVKDYFKLQDREHNLNAAETTAQVKSLVTDAIERQLVSDVPIGTFLSGGLDSSIISAIANGYLKKKGERLKTFSVTYKDNDRYFKQSRFQPNSDDIYIKIMAEYLGSEHHDIVIDTGELCTALFGAVDARDLPGMADVDSSLLLFCGEIKKHVTVALSGECADEIFGGYPWYRDEKIRSAYGFPWAQSTPYRESFLSSDLKGVVDGREFVHSRYESYIHGAPKREGLSDLESRMREMVYLNTYWFMQTLLEGRDVKVNRKLIGCFDDLKARKGSILSRIDSMLLSFGW